MVLDIDLFREEKGGNLEVIRKSQKDRYKNVEIVDKVIQIDVKWRESKFLSIIMKLIHLFQLDSRPMLYVELRMELARQSARR